MNTQPTDFYSFKRFKASGRWHRQRVEGRAVILEHELECARQKVSLNENQLIGIGLETVTYNVKNDFLENHLKTIDDRTRQILRFEMPENAPPALIKRIRIIIQKKVQTTVNDRH